MKLAWYVRRLASMPPSEMVGRARDAAVQQSWRRRQVHRMAADTTPVPTNVAIDLKAPPIDGVDEAAAAAVTAAADDLLLGRWLVFDRWRDDMAPAPDWHRDPRTGRQAPTTAFSFSIDHRDEAAVGNVKYVWETSRHVQCTVLAAAYHLTGDERYASAAAGQLRSWWQANPFLSGIHWTSGIELGLRVIAWVWVRRMLDGWEQARELFERDPVFLRQLRHHQEWLATFPSRGSSANNHLIAEAAGQFAAAVAFDVFDESGTWRDQAAATLRQALGAQVDTSGLHRELATEYHAFVLELVLVAAVEGEVAGHGLGDDVWHTLCRMIDCLAAIVDDEGHPPRQGDADDGHGLVVDAPGYDRWSSLLATGAQLFGPLAWWPNVTSGDVRTAMFAGLVPSAPTPSDRPTARPSVLPAAGQVFLRDVPGHPAPVWCRFDAGRHGMAGIAAHAHADALSIEVRVGGVDLLVDPGTYCYHGEPAWRSYFRSTRGHNTLEVGDRDQSDMGGPFLWTRSVDARLLSFHGLDDGTIVEATAQHDGYTVLDPPAIHRRTVRFHRAARWLCCIDEVETDGRCSCRLSFHLAPHVSCALDVTVATLSWTAEGVPHEARLELAPGLSWASRSGEVEPIAGWYSPAFGQRVPTTLLVGEGVLDGSSRLVTVLHLGDATAPGGPAGGGAVAATS